MLATIYLTETETQAWLARDVEVIADLRDVAVYAAERTNRRFYQIVGTRASYPLAVGEVR